MEGFINSWLCILYMLFPPGLLCGKDHREVICVGERVPTIRLCERQSEISQIGRVLVYASVNTTHTCTEDSADIFDDLSQVDPLAFWVIAGACDGQPACRPVHFGAVEFQPGYTSKYVVLVYECVPYSPGVWKDLSVSHNWEIIMCPGHSTVHISGVRFWFRRHRCLSISDVFTHVSGDAFNEVRRQCEGRVRCASRVVQPANLKCPGYGSELNLTSAGVRVNFWCNYNVEAAGPTTSIMTATTMSSSTGQRHNLTVVYVVSAGVASIALVVIIVVIIVLYRRQNRAKSGDKIATRNPPLEDMNIHRPVQSSHSRASDKTGTPKEQDLTYDSVDHGDTTYCTIDADAMMDSAENGRSMTCTSNANFRAHRAPTSDAQNLESNIYSEVSLVEKDNAHEFEIHENLNYESRDDLSRRDSRINT